MSDSDLKDPLDDGGSLPVSKKSRRWYALYQVSKKSPPSSPTNHASSDDESFMSLSVLASNLPGTDETSLRIFLAQKVEKGSLTPDGASLIAAITLTDSENEEAKYYLHSTLLKPKWLRADSKQTDSPLKGFLVCYGSSVHQELDSFQNELDDHNDTLNGLLDATLSGLDTTVASCLEEWNEKTTQYVSRAVDILKQNLDRVLHATLINSKTSFEGFSADNEKDIRKFLHACSIQWVDKPVAPNTCFFLSQDKEGNTSVEGIDSPIPFFCHHWAGAAHSASDTNRVDSAVAIKAVIEEYKLKVIQDVNNMRRLIKKANEDYYAHYKALLFLKHTGNASVILELLKDDNICSDVKSSSKSPDAVIGILEEFLSAE